MNSYAAETFSKEKGEEPSGDLKTEIKEYIHHHLKDSYDFSLLSYTGEDGKHHYVGLSLPVILWDNGLKVFSSSQFHHGETLANVGDDYYKLDYHSNKIYKTDAAGTINYDVITQAVLNYTSDAGANFTVNLRGDGSNALNAIMDTGESITICHIVPQGGSAYYNNAVTIDGVSITPEWQGGSAPSGGNASSHDVYAYTVIKTADATFTALAAQTQFA